MHTCINQASTYNNIPKTKKSVTTSPTTNKYGRSQLFLRGLGINFPSARNHDCRGSQFYPIEKPTVAELIKLSIEEKGITQKQLAKEIGVSPSRVSDYISGGSEPTLRIARLLCQILDIQPAAMLGL